MTKKSRERRRAYRDMRRVMKPTITGMLDFVVIATKTKHDPCSISDLIALQEEWYKCLAI